MGKDLNFMYLRIEGATSLSNYFCIKKVISFFIVMSLLMNLSQILNISDLRGLHDISLTVINVLVCLLIAIKRQIFIIYLLIPSKDDCLQPYT